MRKYFFMTMMLLLVMSCSKSRKQTETTPVVPEISVAYPVVDSVVLHKVYPGYLTSLQTVELVARVSGYLQKIDYTPGEIVPKGKLLFVIEPTQYQDAVTQAEATLNTANAQLDYAQNNYVRMKEASLSDAISEIDLIKSESSLDQAKASVSNAEAALSAAKTKLSYCYVRAPFAGRVSRSQYDVGNYINGSIQSTTLATIYQDTKMYAYFNIEDNQYLRMVINQNKKLAKEALPDRVQVNFKEPLLDVYYGRMDYLSPNVDLSTGTLTVRAEVDNTKGDLKSGLYVSVSLPYGFRSKAVLVRDASIATDQLGKYVYVVNDSNKVVYRPVEVGQLYNDTLRLINKGLTANERYVTRALLKVHDGMDVKPVVEKN